MTGGVGTEQIRRDWKTFKFHRCRFSGQRIILERYRLSSNLTGTTSDSYLFLFAGVIASWWVLMILRQRERGVLPCKWNRIFSNVWQNTELLLICRIHLKFAWFGDDVTNNNKQRACVKTNKSKNLVLRAGCKLLILTVLRVFVMFSMRLLVRVVLRII